MRREDDFAVRRQHIANLTDEELYAKFWELTDKVVDPLAVAHVQAEGDVNNTNDLSNLGNNKTGTWGGIFSNQGSITNSGNIVLSGGNSAVGIMSAASEESDEVLSGSITTGGKNINNQGNILITADSSYGILAQSLANVANESFPEAETPLPVIAFATCILPLLTDDFKESISDLALHWIDEGCEYA